jgi:hypothetical protein
VGIIAQGFFRLTAFGALILDRNPLQQLHDYDFAGLLGLRYLSLGERLHYNCSERFAQNLQWLGSKQDLSYLTHDGKNLKEDEEKFIGSHFGV